MPLLPSQILKGRARLAGLAAACGLLLAVAAAAAERPEAASPRFQLVILTQDWHDLGRPQDWESAWPRLQKAAGNAFFTIDERDVAAYDWQAQRIFLRPEVGLRLLGAMQKLPDLPERIAKLKALWDSGDLFWAVSYRGFVVTLDGRPLYGGIFLAKWSNLAMNYPVIHCAMDEDRHIVLRFSPIQHTFGSLWDNGTGDALEPTTDPTMRALLSEAPDEIKNMSPGSQELIEPFRRMILDPRIRELFAKLGTPAQPPPAAAAKSREPVAPVRISANPAYRGQSWSLFLGSPEEVADIRYRLAGDTRERGWSVASEHGEASLGDLPPGRYRVELEALDFAGEIVGQYTMWFDPEQEKALEAKEMERIPIVPAQGVLPPQPEPETPAAPAAPQPVTLSTWPPGSGWTLHFNFDSWLDKRELHYRFAGDSEWRSTGRSNDIDLITGERRPRTSIMLEEHAVTPGRHRIEVKSTDWSGRESGPYVLWFDPEQELVAWAKLLLLMPDSVWATFDEDDEAKYFHISSTAAEGTGLREVRYSIDDCRLDRRLGDGQGGKDERYGLVRVPSPVKSVCVQLVFGDGEVTEARQFFRKPQR